MTSTGNLIVRTGVDLVELNRLPALNEAIRKRFIDRVYTAKEEEILGLDFDELSGRFAAKEAVSKALGTGIGKVRWRDIEILRGKFGVPELVLHGLAKSAAVALGLTSWSVSISHSRSHAVAVAVGIGETHA